MHPVRADRHVSGNPTQSIDAINTILFKLHKSEDSGHRIPTEDSDSIVRERANVDMVPIGADDDS